MNKFSLTFIAILKLLLRISIFLVLTVNVFADINSSEFTQAQLLKSISDGRAFVKNKQYRSAILLLEKVKKYSPDNVEVLYILGQAYEGADMYKSALPYMRRAADLSPGVVQLQRDYSRVSRLNGDFDTAISLLETLEAKDMKPSMRKSILSDIAKNQIQKFIRNDDYSSAVNLIQNSILLFPRDAEFYELLGVVYDDADLFEDAELALNIAREKTTDKSAIDVRLSKLYQKNSETNKQRNVLNRILTENKKGKAFNYALSTLLNNAQDNFSSGNVDNALSDAQLVLNNIPGQLEAGKLLSRIYIKRNDFDSAVSNFHRLQEIYPKNIDIRMSLATLYIKTGEIDKAAVQYKEIVKLDKTGKYAQESRDKLSVLRAERVRKSSNKKVDGDELNEILLEINEWISNGDYGPAELYLKSLMLDNSENGRANFLLGKLYSKQSKIALAKKYLTRAIYYSPDQAEYYLFYADYSEKLRDLNAAVQLYENVLDISSDSDVIDVASARIEYIAGEKLINQGLLDEALSHYRGLLIKQPDQKDILIKIATILNRLGRSEESKEITSRISEINRIDQSEDELIDQVKGALKKRDVTTAVSILQGILKSSPANSKANYWMGHILIQQNKTKEAIAYVKRSVELAPDNRKLKLRLAELYSTNRELQKAKDIYSRLLVSPVDIAERLEIERLIGLVQGQQYLDEKSYDQALTHFLDMTKKFTRDIAVLEALAAIYSEKSKIDFLKSTYLAMVEINPSYVSAYGRLSTIYLKEKDLRNWRESLRNVIKYDKLDRVSKQKAIKEIVSVAEKYVLEKKYIQAKIELDAVLSVEPDNLIANLVKAEMHQRQGKLDEAEEIYFLLLSLNPLNYDVRKKLANFYVQQDRLDEAADEYEKITQVSSNDVVVQEASASLHRISKIKAADINMKLTKDSNVNEVLDIVKQWIRDNQIDTAYEVLTELLKYFPENAQVHYWLGTVYERKNQLALSLEHIKKSVALAPSNPRLRTAYGQVLVRAGEFDEAEKQYNIVIETGGNTAFTHETKKLLGFAIGQRFIKDSQLEEALAHYTEMYKEYPNDLKILAQLGAVNLQLTNFNTAEKIYKQIIEVQPDNVSIHFQLAIVYKEKNEHEKFNQQLRQVILLDPNGFGLQAANQLGLADGNRYLAQRNWVDAITSFQQVLETDNKNVHANLGITKALFESGNKKRAEELLLKVLGEQPTNTTVRLELAKLYVMTNRIQAAVLELERIIFVDGDSPIGKEAKINLANIYRSKAELLGKRGDIAGAVKEYLNAVNRDPRDIKAHLALAGIYQRDRRFINNSIAHYKEAIKVDPHNFQVYVNLGTLYERLRNYIKSADAFSLAIASMNENINTRIATRLMLSVRLQVARQQYIEKNYDWVVEELLDMLSYEPGNSQINIFLSGVYTVQGKLDLAIVVLRKVLEKTPNNWDVRYRLAVLYERTSEDELALAQYRTIVRANSAGNLVEQARDRIPSLEDRVRNFNYSVTYTLSQSRTNSPNTQVLTSAFNSSLRFDFTTRYRPSKNLNISFRVSPTYSALHESQNDSLSPEYGILGQYNTNNIFFTTNASFRETKGLLFEDFRGEESNISLAVSKRLDTPLIQTDDDRSLPQTIQYQLQLRNFSSEGLSFSSTREVTPSISFVYPLRTGGSITANYSFTDTQNTDQFGSDYANYGYNLSLSVRSLIGRKLSASFSSNFTHDRYKNFDSREQHLNNRLKKRENWTFSISARFNYQFHRRLALFSSVSAVDNRSNIEQGFIYWAKDVPIGFQNSTLTDYRSLNFSTGVSFRF